MKRTIREEVDTFSKELSKEIAERGIFDVDKLATFLSTRLFILVRNAVNDECTKLKDEKLRIAAIIKNGGAINRRELEDKIAELNVKIKRLNFIYHRDNHFEENLVFRRMIREEFGDDKLNSMLVKLNDEVNKNLKQ